MTDVQKVTWAEVHVLCQRLIQTIAPRPGFTPVKAIVAIVRGGLAPQAILSNHLDIRSPNLGWVGAISYNHQEKEHGVSLHLNYQTEELLYLETTLVIDEIFDSGTTMHALRKLFPLPLYAALYKRNGSPDFPNLLWFENAAMSKWLQFPWEPADVS